MNEDKQNKEINGRKKGKYSFSVMQAADEEYVTTFTIDQYNGNITLMRSLDYEKHSYYQFRIMAEVGESF